MDIVEVIAIAVVSVVLLGITLYSALLAYKLFTFWRLTRASARARSREEHTDARIRKSLQIDGFKKSEIEEALRDSRTGGPSAGRK